jgi:protein-disulfide isomerase
MGTVIGGAILIAAALIILSARTATTPGSKLAPTSSAAGTMEGSPAAKVTVVEYADYQCPYCARFALNTYPKIRAAYIETGQVRWVFRNFAFLGQESLWAAEAAECAAEQGQFLPYHDKLFRSQAGENRGAFSKDNLKRFARELGLDGAAFDDCLDSGRYREKVQQDTARGRRQGVRATPTFFIDGRQLRGAQPFSAFQAAIEKALSEGK